MRAGELSAVLKALTDIRNILGDQSAAALCRDAASRYLGISTATLDRLTSAGKLKSVRVSQGRVVWRRSDLDDYLNSLS